MRKLSWYGYAGIVMLFISWNFNWILDGLRTHIFFFPQWLGLILFVDAWVYSRKKTSLIHRNLKKFILLFIISIPVWWLFELLNTRNQNWHYEGREYFTDIEFFVLASINFSTVIPSVFEMTDLISSFKWSESLRYGPKISCNKINAAILMIGGIMMLMIDLLFPRYFYFFIWISLYFISEGSNVFLNHFSLLKYTGTNNWRPLYLLALGSLSCGLLWEFWNYFSYPKWIYHIPYLGFMKVFEMPVLGYLGYIPFGFELYAMYILLMGINQNSDPYVALE